MAGIYWNSLLEVFPHVPFFPIPFASFCPACGALWLSVPQFRFNTCPSCPNGWGTSFHFGAVHGPSWAIELHESQSGSGVLRLVPIRVDVIGAPPRLSPQLSAPRLVTPGKRTTFSCPDATPENQPDRSLKTWRIGSKPQTRPLRVSDPFGCQRLGESLSIVSGSSPRVRRTRR